MSSESTPQTSDFIQKWTEALAPCPTRPGNRVDYLIDGWAAFSSMHDAIAGTLKGDCSSYYIYFLGWWLDDALPLIPGDSNTTLLHLIAQASDKKVQVRVILWDNLFKKIYESVYGNGRSPKDQVDSINGLPGAAAILDSHTLKHQSQHQKLLVVGGPNGLVAFCGGIDVARDRVEVVKGHPGSPFHDVHCRIEGYAARDLLHVFVRRWRTHPASKPIDEKEKLRGESALPVDKPKEYPSVANAYVGIIRTFIRPEGPCKEEMSIAPTMLNLIKLAKRFIYIEDQYMVGLDAAEALGIALRHLQHITVLIPHSAISDLPRVWEARAAFVDKVRSVCGPNNGNKFRVFYKCGSVTLGSRKDFPENPGPRDFGRHTYVHSKTWIIDDQIAVIGSANCNRRSWYFDSEVAAVIFDKEPGIPPFSFPQKVRIALWQEHLGLDKNKFVNGVESAHYWVDSINSDSMRQLVRPYVPQPSPKLANGEAAADWDSSAGMNLSPSDSPPQSDADTLLGWLVAPAYRQDKISNGQPSFFPDSWSPDPDTEPNTRLAWDYLVDPPPGNEFKQCGAD